MGKLLVFADLCRLALSIPPDGMSAGGGLTK